MAKMIDIAGQKFNKLTAMKPVGKYKTGNTLWLCQCECGNEAIVESYMLRSGKQKSCGCYPSERMKKMNTKHGGFGTRLYEIWREMRRRCYGESTKAYPDYGGRGITICKEWDDFSTFQAWALANGYSDELTIDRIDVNGNYEPSNCRWATMKQQANNRRTSHKIEYSGETRTISEWADSFGVNQVKLWDRLSRNEWNIGTLIESGAMKRLQEMNA